MVILNSEMLLRTKRMRDAASILESGLAAADPTSIIPKFVGKNTIRMRDRDINLDEYGAVYTVAFGKAAPGSSGCPARLRVPASRPSTAGPTSSA